MKKLILLTLFIFSVSCSSDDNANGTIEVPTDQTVEVVNESFKTETVNIGINNHYKTFNEISILNNIPNDINVNVETIISYVLNGKYTEHKVSDTYFVSSYRGEVFILEWGLVTIDARDFKLKSFSYTYE